MCLFSNHCLISAFPLNLNEFSHHLALQDAGCRTSPVSSPILSCIALSSTQCPWVPWGQWLWYWRHELVTSIERLSPNRELCLSFAFRFGPFPPFGLSRRHWCFTHWVLGKGFQWDTNISCLYQDAVTRGALIWLLYKWRSFVTEKTW